MSQHDTLHLAQAQMIEACSGSVGAGIGTTTREVS